MFSPTLKNGQAFYNASVVAVSSKVVGLAPDLNETTTRKALTFLNDDGQIEKVNTFTLFHIFECVPLGFFV
jgi:hypothetical protein